MFKLLKAYAGPILAFAWEGFTLSAQFIWPEQKVM